MAEPIPEKEIEGAYELPEGWVWATIGDACEINPKSSNLSDLDQSLPTTFVPMSAVDQMEGVIETPEVLSLGKARKGHTHFIENDVIFAKITPCMENGKVAIAKNLVNGLGFGSTEFHVIRPPEGVIPKFVFYFLRQEIFRKEASVHFTSTVGQMRVPKAFMMDAPFPLPPLAEQRRITAKLEALLAQVNAAKDHLAAVPPIIKRFRQSVLATACSGRLTEDWRKKNPDVEPASELLERIREERVRKYEEGCRRAREEGRRKPKSLNQEQVGIDIDLHLPQEWVWTNIDNIGYVTKLAGFEYTKYVNLSASGEIPVVRAQNVQMGVFVERNLKYISEETSNFLERSKLHGGEILMAFIGAGTGNVAILPSHKRYHLGPNVAKIVPEIITNKFLCYYLQSPLGFLSTMFWKKETAQPSLSMKTIRKISVPLPPLPEQHEIVRRVEERVAAATAHVDRLTQSILAKAFRGELVPQDPYDEPASVLLERIRKERTELKKKKKPRKRRSKTLPDSN